MVEKEPVEAWKTHVDEGHLRENLQESLIRKAIELVPENTVYTTNLQQVLSQAAMRHR